MCVDPECVEWVRSAQAGHPESFERLVERTWCEMVRLARSVIGDAEAEDCVQDALVAAWHALPELEDPARFRGWLARIVFRRALRASRWSRLRTALTLWREPIVGSREPEAEMDAARLLESLPPRQRAVVHLTIVEGMSDSEIGHVLSISPATVRAHRRRARESVEQRLKRRK